MKFWIILKRIGLSLLSIFVELIREGITVVSNRLNTVDDPEPPPSKTTVDDPEPPPVLNDDK
jgi:hypothetical protein